MTQKTGAVGDVYYGDTASDYHDRRSKSRRWKSENLAVKKYLGNLPKRLSVLDLPFGTGRFVPYYMRQRHRVTGVDVSIDMLKAARKLMGPEELNACHLMVGDATDIQFLDDTFDVVVCTRFLQNIIPLNAARKSLSEMARVCRGHGIIQIEIRKHNAHRLSIPQDDEPMRGLLFEHEITDMFEDAGFVINDTFGVYDNGESDYAILLCQKRR